MHNLKKLIHEHIAKRPRMQVVDVYKLLYQGVFGPGHIIGDLAWSELKNEAETLDINNYLTEPIVETVSPDNKMVRVNLRPYLRKEYDLKELYNAIKNSCEINPAAALRDFLKSWKIFKDMIEKGELDLPLEDAKKIEGEADFPKPKHHSEIYQKTYSPAYRVVKYELINYIEDAT